VVNRLPGGIGKPENSNFGSLRQRQRIVDIYAEISHSILDIGMAKQDLDGS
jgi:hypothetical protein